MCLVTLDAERHHDLIMLNFEKLRKKCDPKRSGMYTDMAAHIQTYHKLNRPLKTGNSLLESLIAGNCEEITLSLPSLELRRYNLSPFFNFKFEKDIRQVALLILF